MRIYQIVVVDAGIFARRRTLRIIPGFVVASFLIIYQWYQVRIYQIVVLDTGIFARRRTLRVIPGLSEKSEV